MHATIYIGIPITLSKSIGAVLLVLSGILNEKEALDSIHQPTIFLFAGVLTLSEAIKITGAGDVVADWMISLIGNTTNPYLIMAVFFLIPFLLTQIMSNLATLTIFIPLVVSDLILQTFFLYARHLQMCCYQYLALTYIQQTSYIKLTPQAMGFLQL